MLRNLSASTATICAAVLGTISSAVYFSLDIHYAPDVLVGVLYTTVVLFGLLAHSRRAVLFFACTSTVLLVLGWVLNPAVDSGAAGLINRTLALFVIWAITGMAYHYLGAQQELEAALRHLAESDPLTQILNRVGIMSELGRRLAEFQRYGSVFSVLMIDVDRFKHINDRLGHLAGDQVLRRIAGIARSALREVDSVGRYGGEEFLVVLPGTPLDSAVNTAERIRIAIEQIPIRIQRESIHVTASIGAASIEHGRSQTAEQLVDDADRAMYEAKRGGRNRVVPASRTPSVRVVGRASPATTNPAEKEAAACAAPRRESRAPVAPEFARRQ